LGGRLDAFVLGVLHLLVRLVGSNESLQLSVGQGAEHVTLGDRVLNVAEDALLDLELAVEVLREHPEDGQQHQDARHAENDVERLLIAVMLVGSSHWRPLSAWSPVRRSGPTGCVPWAWHRVFKY